MSGKYLLQALKSVRNKLSEKEASCMEAAINATIAEMSSCSAAKCSDHKEFRGKRMQNCADNKNRAATSAKEMLGNRGGMP